VAVEEKPYFRIVWPLPALSGEGGSDADDRTVGGVEGGSDTGSRTVEGAEGGSHVGD
jgi:hypothetical protein